MVRAALEIETGITGAGFALRRRGRRADGPQNQPKYIQAYLMCRQRTRISARARTMRPFACEYGARGAALFDIVNVQIWTRRWIPARATSSPSGWERRRDPFVNFPRAGLAHRAEHSPRKREAGGSSPPASTTVNGRNRPVAGHRFGKAETGVRSAVAAPYCTRGETADAAASEAVALRHGGSSPPGCTILIRSLRQAAKASVLHTDIPRFESWSEHHPLP